MKRLLALTLIMTAAFTACGKSDRDETSDLLNGILENSGGSDSVVEENYEEPVSSGPTMLPPEDEESELVE